MRGLCGIVLAILALAGCGRTDALVDIELFAMGTWLDLSLPPGALERHPDLLARIEAELSAFERDYYAWADGELAALNRGLSEAGRFDTDADMAAVLATARDISLASEGAFDPGVGALVELWGFDDSSGTGTPPSPEAIAARLQAYGSIATLDIDGNEVSVSGGAGSAYLLDLGGIAKGEIVDRIAALLAAEGIAPALVNAGGDLRVVGERGARPWRIGIQAPRGDGLLGAITLTAGEAAFSSGDYERFYEDGGERLHHILDPRSGRPVTHTQAVTVVATEGLTADAAATALFVAGPEDWTRLAAALGIEAALRVDASGAIEMTSAMRDRFQPGTGAGSDIIVRVD